MICAFGWFLWLTASTVLNHMHCCIVALLIYTHAFNGPFSGLPRWASTRKAKPIWILLKQETVSGSGISWNICKSAPRSRQITMPAPHYSVFYRPDALPAAQPTASKHWRLKKHWRLSSADILSNKFCERLVEFGKLVIYVFRWSLSWSMSEWAMIWQQFLVAMLQVAWLYIPRLLDVTLSFI